MWQAAVVLVVAVVVQHLHAIMQDIKVHLPILERRVLVVTATIIVLDGHMPVRNDKPVPSLSLLLPSDNRIDGSSASKKVSNP
jgi:hypothetical protein